MQIIQKKSLEVEGDWQKEIANAFKHPAELLNYLQIPDDHSFTSIEATKLFPMMVPRFFANLMQLKTPNDPLLKQVLPVGDEFISIDGFTADPLQEEKSASQGLVQKYKNRVLLVLRGGCAVNCRYCFRRHFPYQDHHLNRAALQNALYRINDDQNVDEVILSGGDPLMAKDDHLQSIVNELTSIKHIKRLRIHTRLPVVIPSRITDELLDMLGKSSLTVTFVLHINHPNEISRLLQAKCKALLNNSIRIFNQAVLLKDVNDDPSIQMALNEQLYEAGIQPYYLHMFDKVKGASHFYVSDSRAKQIMRDVVANQSGYMVPKLVREVPDKPSKMLINIYSD